MMKRLPLIICGVIVLSLALSVVGWTVLAKEKASAGDSNETTVPWDKTPEIVQRTVEAQLHTTSPEQIVQETDDGFTTYEAKRKIDGREKEVKVGTGGQVLEIEEAVPQASLPVAVADAIKKARPNGKIKAIKRVTSYFYEVEFSKPGQDLRLFENGQPVDGAD